MRNSFKPLTLLPLLLATMATTGCVNLPAGLLGPVRGPMRKEVVVRSKGFFPPSAQLLLVDLVGFVGVRGEKGMFGGGGEGMLVELTDRLEAAREDPRIRGLLLRIDSPGGSASASDLVHHELVRFKREMEEERGRPFPIVAFMEGMAASGGLYAAMAADEIHATPTTITGSIGVIAMLPGIQGLSEKIGLEMRVLKSGDNKDVGSPWREMTEGDRAILQRTIDSMYGRFLEVVQTSRSSKGLDDEKLAVIADGRALTATEALEAGLIDEIGYMEGAIADLRERVGALDAAVVAYGYPGQYRGNNVYAASRTGGSAPRTGGIEGVLEALAGGMESRGPRFLHLWAP